MQNYTDEELAGMGIAFGESVAIHRTVALFGPEQLRIGNRVRIDCHCILSAGDDGIEIGNNVHLGAGGYYFGSGGPIRIEDFAGISARACVYTASDDFLHGWLTGPTIPEEFRKVTKGGVTVRRHTIVGAGTMILPGVVLGTACAIGAQSLVKADVEEFAIVAGNPIKHLGVRNRRILELERLYLATLGLEASSVPPGDPAGPA